MGDSAGSSRRVRFADEISEAEGTDAAGLVRGIGAIRRLPARAIRQMGDVRRNAHAVFQVELDSHAEQCCVSELCALIIHDHERPVTVVGYDNGQGRTLRTVDAVVGYTDPSTGDKWWLVINQALLVPGMLNPLLCTNQLRANDIRVNDEPKHLVLNPTKYHHAIAVETPDGNEQVEELVIPLQLSGVFSYFEATKPSSDDWMNAQEDWCLHLTYDAPEWAPDKLGFERAEAAMTGDDGHVTERYAGDWSQERVDRVIAALSKERIMDPSASELAVVLKSHVHVPSEGRRSVKSIKTAKKQWKVGPLALAKRWGIGVGAARRTIDATTQVAVRSLLMPTLTRRFAAHDKLLRFRRLPCQMYTDTMKGKVRSWMRQSLYGQVYVTDFGWVGFYPMKAKSEAPDTLVQLAHEVGVPTHFVMDNSREQTMGRFRKKARSFGCGIRQVDTYSAWQNDAEGGVREIKKGTGRAMVRSGAPQGLWDHCAELQAKIISHTARGHYKLQNQVPETMLTGQTADISPLAEYGWYDWVIYWDHVLGKEALGRWLGPSPDEVGSAMTSKVLTKKGQLYHTPTVRPLSLEEWSDEKWKTQRTEFDAGIVPRLGAALNEADLESVDPDAVTPEFVKYSDRAEGTHEHYPDADEIHKPIPDTESDNTVEDQHTPAVDDHYIGATVDITHMGELRTGTVREQVRDDDGRLIGTANENPILVSRLYKVEFPNGEVTEYTANIIAESMIAQTDSNGNDIKLLEEIVDHKSDGNAVKDADRYFMNRGRQYPKKTTAGWKLCVQWKGGLTTWETLADLKESYPVQVAEYAKAAGIQHEPAFAWWTEHVLKKRDRIIAKVAKRYNKVTHKFGIEVPTSVEHAYEIDRKNGNNLWREAIEKEMVNVRIAFKVLSDDDEIAPGYQQMSCHMIFDIKLSEGFRRKARLVAGGHQVDTPSHLTYATVVSRETVRIALTLAALNGLEVKASDIQNAFLTAPCAEKIWTRLGPEFGPDAGKKAIIVRALYGLASAGASFNAHLADCMKHLGYSRCKADPDLWMKPDKHPDGERYYRYILLYCDDCLSIGLNAKAELERLDHYFQMKPGSIADPDIYLGNKLKLTRLENGVVAWGLSSSKYIQEAIANCKRHLEKHPEMGKQIKRKTVTQWPAGYDAELDSSEELNSENATFYQHLIGVLHWIVELNRVDIITEVSILAGYLCNPRDGHLDAALHVYSYLENKHNARLVLDPSYPDIDRSKFIEGRDWLNFYGDVKEELPPDMPEPLGKDVDVSLYVDSSHANDKSNRRSRTGFFVYLNSALIQWCSKKQPTIETSVFGAEFVAMKHGIETVRGIRYKLRMMGVRISGPTFVWGDNMSVIHNTQRPESTLKKKSNSICYHAIRESVASGESLTGHIASTENPADIATKIIPSGQLREKLVGKLLRDIYDDKHLGPHQPKAKKQKKD